MDTMFQCFHLPDLTFQYSFGTQGQGPNDFVLPSITPVKYQKNGFVMLDGINLKHISVEKDKATVQTSTLNYGFNCFNDLISISDSSYCCNGGFENLGFFILTEIMNHGENIPKQRNVSDLFWAGIKRI